MRKSGFTLVEFLISISVMMIVMASAFPVLFKKTTKERENNYVVNGEIHCIQNGCTIKTMNQEQLTRNANFEFTLGQADKPEFVKIRVVGGGGGGASGCPGRTESCKGGAAGEIKNVIYPTLEGRFLAVIGNGGAPNNNGSASALYQEIDGQWQLIASARGGITSRECALSEAQSLGEVLEEGYGNGGNAGASGNSGEVKITW